MEAPDRSSLRGEALLPVLRRPTGRRGCGCGCRSHAVPAGQGARTPLDPRRDVRRRVPRRLGYNQPASPSRRWASWRPAAATPRPNTSRAAKRRSTFPRTARSAWSASRFARTRRCRTARRTSIRFCARRSELRRRTRASGRRCSGSLPEIDKRTRELMRDSVAEKTEHAPARRSSAGHERGGRILRRRPRREFFAVLDKVPMAYQKANAIFATPEKKSRAAAASSRSSSPISAKAAPRASPLAAITRR